MCGRYTLAHAEAAKAALERLGIKMAKELTLPTRYNVAPTQVMPVVLGGAAPELVAFQWGHLAQFDTTKPPQLIINGRSEMAAEKRTFKKAVQERRCIVPADGFFEWMKTQGGKVRVPYYIRRKDGETFWIAGLYWPETAEGPAHYILLTTRPNELMAPIHDRMPVILDDEAAKEWLASGSLLPARMGALCASYPSDQLVASRVDPLVNNARNDTPECIVPAPASSFDEQHGRREGELF